MNLVVRWHILVVVVLGLVAAARGETVLGVPLAAGSEANIKIALTPAQPPRFGFAPVRVTIENSAPQERTWRFDFRAGVGGQPPGLVAYARSVTVPAGQTRDTWIYVPVGEAGNPGAAPTLSAAGISGPTNTGGANPSTRVTITKTPTGTKVVRTTLSPSTGMVFMTEETTIDATTGELNAVTSSPSGGMSNTRSSKPPAGGSITYTIDPNTGFVSSRSSSPSGVPKGPTRVTILTGPAGPGGTSPGGPITPVKVTIEPTPIGTRVTRLMSTSSGGTGARTYTEEREIDAQSGIITTTMTSPAGTPMPARTSAPLNPGTETTYTINPTTGMINTTTRIAANPKAPPKVTIVTGPSSSPGVTATTSSTGGVSLTRASGAASTAASGSAPASPRPLSRIVPSGFSGPPMTLSVEVIGPGTSGSRVTFSPLGSTANMRPLAATLALERVLREGLNNEGIRTPNLTLVEPTQLPADWRTWSPYAAVLLAVDDYAGLDAARRAALRGWVALGGELLLVPATEGTRWSEPVGAGAIVTLAAPLKTAPSAGDLLTLGISLGATPAQPDVESLVLRPGNPLGDALAERETDTTWLTVFLVVFAAVIGPVNLYLFAPAAKRHRLFITTPLISLGAALVLGVTILVQDGTGGIGERRMLVTFVPGDNAAAVFQEQASLTGLLTGSAFPLAPDTQLTVLPLDDLQPNMFRGMGSSQNLERDDARASGGWFRSRTRQAHLLQRLVPTRGRIERVGTSPDGAPMVQSSIAGALRNFSLVDENLVVWSARELVPGRRVTLDRGGTWIGSEAKAFGGSRRFGSVFAAATFKYPGRWGAKGEGGELAPLATHDAIRWTPSEVVYTGTIEGMAAPKEAKP